MWLGLLFSLQSRRARGKWPPAPAHSPSYPSDRETATKNAPRPGVRDRPGGRYSSNMLKLIPQCDTSQERPTARHARVREAAFFAPAADPEDIDGARLRRAVCSISNGWDPGDIW